MAAGILVAEALPVLASCCLRPDAATARLVGYYGDTKLDCELQNGLSFRVGKGKKSRERKS